MDEETTLPAAEPSADGGCGSLIIIILVVVGLWWFGHERGERAQRRSSRALVTIQLMLLDTTLESGINLLDLRKRKEEINSLVRTRQADLPSGFSVSSLDSAIQSSERLWDIYILTRGDDTAEKATLKRSLDVCGEVAQRLIEELRE